MKIIIRPPSQAFRKAISKHPLSERIVIPDEEIAPANVPCGSRH